MTYFRFHKSKALLPGVRVNLSKSGASLSIGPKDAKVNIGPQGERTTVSLPGTGLSLIDQASWKPRANRKRRRTNDAVDAPFEEMTRDRWREIFARRIEESSLADAMAQRKAFEAYIAEHAAEIDDGDTSDLEEARRIYANAIPSKRAEARRQAGDALVLAVIAGLLMWCGVAAGNGWAVAGSLALFLVAGGTKGGQRFLSWLSSLLLGVAALGFVPSPSAWPRWSFSCSRVG